MTLTARILGLLAALTMAACAAPQTTRKQTTGKTWFLRWLGQPTRVTVDVGGRIVRVKRAREPAKGDVAIGRSAEAVARPGLHDAHIHLMGTGRVHERVNLRDATRAQLKERVAAFAKANPDVRVITGRGWDQSQWQDKAFPTWRDLAGATDKPVLIRRVDGHAALANKAMMKLAGVDRNTKTPQGGRIERDAKGELTGLFVDTAMDMLRKKIPAASMADRRRWLRTAVEAVADNGFVAAHDMGMGLATLDALVAEDKASPLPLRVYVYLDGDDRGALGWLRTNRGKARRLSPRIRVMGMKLFADGAMGSRGAALLQDYSDKPGHRGALILKPEELKKRVKEVHNTGAQVAIHAIGDRAVRVGLDAIGAAQGSDTSRRHRIEHAQLVHPDDFARFAKLNVTASMQPCHLLSDRRWVIARLGAERAKGAYAWATMRRLGVRMVFGSDSPVEPFAHRRGLRLAEMADHAAQPAWMRARLIPGASAWQAYSTAAARAVHDDRRTGLEPGRLLEVTVDGPAGTVTVVGTRRRAKRSAPNR